MDANIDLWAAQAVRNVIRRCLQAVASEHERLAAALRREVR